MKLALHWQILIAIAVGATVGWITGAEATIVGVPLRSRVETSASPIPSWVMTVCVSMAQVHRFYQSCCVRKDRSCEFRQRDTQTTYFLHSLTAWKVLL